MARVALLIGSDIYEAMIAQCRESPGRASCGILAGIPPRATAIYPLRNRARNSVRYEADAQDLFRAAVDLRKRSLTITAIYHSCPGSDAVPTLTDLRENFYGEIPRVIISLAEPDRVRVWRLGVRRRRELDWGLLSQDDGAESVVVRPAVERPEGLSRLLAPLGDLLERAFHRIWPAERKPVDRAAPGHGPMWDPLLDDPRERGARDD